MALLVMRVMGREIMEESSSTSRMENAVMMTVMMTSWARSVSTVVLMGVMVASTMTMTGSAPSSSPRVVRMPYSSCSVEAAWAVALLCMAGESSRS